MKVKLSELTDLSRKVLNHYGYNKEETDILLDTLMYAQLRGNNQGLVKLIGKGMPKDPKAGPIKIEKETKISARINGNKTVAMVVLKKATELALKKAKEHGIGIVGTNNTNTSTGAIGYHANEIAKEGLIGFIYAGSPERVCMHGSYQPMFGTNPFAIGIPTDENPVVFDMATAAIANYGLIEAKVAGRQIPPDIAYDKDGVLTTDPAKALEGATRPFDRSHKGASLAMIVEVLTGPLVGAAFAGIGDSAGNWGNLVMVMDPDLLADKKTFQSDVSKLAQKVKTAKKLPGVEEIFLPGERGNRLAQKRLNSGEIEMEDNLYRELKKVIGA